MISRGGSLTRLLPQALIITFLAGGTSAFVVNDKAVAVTIDGERTRTLHTFADDVGELLEAEDIRTGAHDRISPSPATPLADGDTVAVHRARPMFINVDGERRKIWTTARSVDEALRALGIDRARAKVASSRAGTRRELSLDVRTERTVTVLADGRHNTVRTTAGTIRDALAAAGITLGEHDTASAPLDSFPREGQAIKVMRVEQRKHVRKEAIGYRTISRPDPHLYRGTTAVSRPGREGVREVTYRVRTVNGARQRPVRTNSEVLRPPQPRVVRIGTKAPPVGSDGVPGADGLDWDALAACESGGRATAVDASGSYGGLYQFDTGTWRGLGGTGRPQDAPAAEQTKRAKKLYQQRGAAPWPGCGRNLYR
ncbi:ubiquitin-like domain-containing protein [Streptomyces boninensis]|uniref:ubiquitin-like domain-containing protein n=1 Tax=Streptomyces boninensis TaxID=2039455 RepID=UPI003B20FD7E